MMQGRYGGEAYLLYASHRAKKFFVNNGEDLHFWYCYRISGVVFFNGKERVADGGGDILLLLAAIRSDPT